MRRRLLAAVVLALACPALAAAFSDDPETDGYILAAANSGGSHGTYWATEVWIHNPGSSTAVVSFRLLPAGRAGDAGRSFGEMRVEPGETAEIGNLLGYFGVIDPVGAVEYRVESGPAVFVQSRTSSQGAESPAIAASGPNAAGTAEDPLVLRGFRRGTSFRTNLALVNPMDVTITVEVVIHDDADRTVVRRKVAIPPFAYHAWNDVGSTEPGLRVRSGRIEVRPEEGERVFALATVVGDDGSVTAMAARRASEPEPSEP